ncbi:bifunctional adenosylcobinamide kinase/adenosylcobinamide-phosphate guanylyltransferase [Pedococcus sp. NPDC057267]|uniref:bifunctional adenosylcobinamide kinase/adenosylcobinamide-phosphate guanylyltransferase n=1 Tax=Pedococcus sp. NPDC057267 TaxID=3346077 RepID=UPI003645F109
MRTLVLGGIRSGKSAVAEGLVAVEATGHGSAVTYVATGPRHDDPDWAERIAAHQRRRPSSWRTIESTDLPATLAGLEGPAVVDCLGTWLTAQLDDLDVWDAPRSRWEPVLDDRLTGLAEAVERHRHPLVLISNEVGLALVPDNRAGRIFADWLGFTNQRVAAACDAVQLVVAGQALPVKQP